MMVASTAARGNDRSWPNNGSVPKTALGGPRVSLVRIVALPHILMAATRLEVGTAKHTRGPPNVCSVCLAIGVDTQIRQMSLSASVEVGRTRRFNMAFYSRALVLRRLLSFAATAFLAANAP
jgi:hypothetical protein